MAMAAQPSQVRDTGAMNWTYLLDLANGGPGEPPGYAATVASLRSNPPTRQPSKRKDSKKGAVKPPASLNRPKPEPRFKA